ncbi:MAG: energy transducer TonB [Magnetococcales bacterium]|nr:energy transducer TonB [Magnetococcales bacterium]
MSHQIADGSAVTTTAAVELSVTTPDRPIAYQFNPKPDYPAVARRMGMEGTVVVAVTVSIDGRPVVVTLRHSSGHALLDRVARDAVADWRFIPAIRNGQPTEETIEIPVQFRLTAQNDQ